MIARTSAAPDRHR